MLTATERIAVLFSLGLFVGVWFWIVYDWLTKKPMHVRGFEVRLITRESSVPREKGEEESA